MDREGLLELLRSVSKGEKTPEEAEKKLRTAPFEDIGYAKIDHHRAMRQDLGEVIYADGKTAEQIIGIAGSILTSGGKDILLTRLNKETAAVVAGSFDLEYHALPRVGIIARSDKKLVGSVVVAAGGTSDIPVAEEAALTAEISGSRVTCLYDVGVAGLHRLLPNIDLLADARAIVAVAGMEGALASVVGGLVRCPVIAVPTSVGYGASFGGVAALLAMLNSCASGVSVVNIDNGFGAGIIASRINRMEGVSE